MNKEEKQAIDTLQNCIADYVIGDFCVGKYCPQEDVCKNDDCPFEKAIDTVVNLIEKQQKEIEELKELNKKLDAQIDLEWVENNYIEKSKYKKLLKVIHKMAKYINDTDFYTKRCEKCINNNINNNNERECIKCIENHFLRGVK